MSSRDASDVYQTDQLSDVTLSDLQLNQQPFGPVSSSGETFVDETSEEQLADVKQALITGDDLLLILGEPGSGKSMLLSQLGNNSGLRIQCFAVKGSPRFSTLNLFAGMLEAFKHKPPEKLEDILDDLVPCLQTMVARNTLSAIVLDDANQISEDELTRLLTSLLYINGHEQTLMRVALAAPPEFEDRIPDLLPGGADLPYSGLTIDGMTRDRAEHYLDFRLQNAGYFGELPFTEYDIDDIVMQSGGFPAGIQVAAASILNQQYDPSEPGLGTETFSRQGSASFLQSRKGKFALGAVALLLIVAGLAMFMPDSGNEDRRYETVANSSSDDIAGNAADTSEGESINSGLNGDLTISNPQDGDASSAEEGEFSKPRVVETRKIVPYEDVSQAIDSLANTPGTRTDNSGTSGQSASNQSTSNTQERDTGDFASGDTASNGSVNTNQNASSPREDMMSEDIIIVEPNESNADTTAGEPAGDFGSSDRTAGSASAPDAPEAGQTQEREITVVESEFSEAAAADERAREGALEIAENGVIEPLQSESPESARPDGASIDGNSLDMDPGLVDILESPTWILVQSRQQITVQMSASRDRSSIESFLKRNRDILEPPNSIYTFRRNGETWYALLHGLYNNFEAAQLAVQQMPPSALTDQPWIRNVGRVQDVLRAQ